MVVNKIPSIKLSEVYGVHFSVFIHKNKSTVIRVIWKKNPFLICTNSANIYLLKLNNRNTRERWEICSKLATVNF